MNHAPAVADDPHPAVRRQALRDEMQALVERLVAEYAATIPAGTVIRCVSRCREQLLRAGLRQGLVAATEAAARHQLSKKAPRHSWR